MVGANGEGVGELSPIGLMVNPQTIKIGLGSGTTSIALVLVLDITKIG